MDKQTNDETRTADDQVADLLRHARRRAPAPQAARERAFAKLHGHWSARQQQKRRRRAVLGMALAASTVLAVGMAFFATDSSLLPAAVAVAELQRTSGNGIQVIGADGQVSPAANAELLLGQTLRTRAGSRAALAWNSGGSLRMDEATEIELIAADRVRLVSGTVYFDSEPAVADNGIALAFSIETPFGLATHVGTQFQTRLHNDRLTLSVREGEVAVAAAGQRVLLPAGDEVDFDRSGVSAERKIQTWDERWQWVQAIAPAFAAEGNSVQALLNWIARETGYVVSYRDNATAEFVSRVIVHGLDKLSPMSALQSIPYVADLQYELHDGVIVVSLLDLPR
ncbi:FecR domain-containing protein [Woeseia oceani]|nr:FecR domain-containing protein [Woeseia oceani]